MWLNSQTLSFGIKRILQAYLKKFAYNVFLISKLVGFDTIVFWCNDAVNPNGKSA